MPVSSKENDRALDKTGGGGGGTCHGGGGVQNCFCEGFDAQSWTPFGNFLVTVSDLPCKR